MKGNAFYMTIHDLMKLTGQDYSSAARTHLTIRETMAEGKKNLLIEEYCQYTKDNFELIWKILRGSKKL
jgi:hypothetical protein